MYVCTQVNVRVACLIQCIGTMMTRYLCGYILIRTVCMYVCNVCMYAGHRILYREWHFLHGARRGWGRVQVPAWVQSLHGLLCSLVQRRDARQSRRQLPTARAECQSGQVAFFRTVHAYMHTYMVRANITSMCM